MLTIIIAKDLCGLALGVAWSLEFVFCRAFVVLLRSAARSALLFSSIFGESFLGDNEDKSPIGQKRT